LPPGFPAVAIAGTRIRRERSFLNIMELFLNYLRLILEFNRNQESLLSAILQINTADVLLNL
jgi:hypothetical protein